MITTYLDVTFNFTTGVDIERSERVELRVTIIPPQKAALDCWGVPLDEDRPLELEWEVLAPHSIMLAGKLKKPYVQENITDYLTDRYHEKFRLANGESTDSLLELSI